MDTLFTRLIDPIYGCQQNDVRKYCLNFTIKSKKEMMISLFTIYNFLSLTVNYLIKFHI